MTTMTPTGTEARLCALIAERQAVGLKKYGATVEGNPLSLREWLVHQRDELLDGAIYAQRAIEEIDRKATGQDAGEGSAERINSTTWRFVGPLPEFGYGSNWRQAQADYFRRNGL